MDESPSEHALRRIERTPCRFGLVGSMIHLLTTVALVAVVVKVIQARRCTG